MSVFLGDGGRERVDCADDRMGGCFRGEGGTNLDVVDAVGFLETGAWLLVEDTFDSQGRARL